MKTNLPLKIIVLISLVLFSAQNSFSSGEMETAATLAAPRLISPPDQSKDTILLPAFVWSSVPGANTYQIQLSSDSAFSHIIRNRTLLTDTIYKGDTYPGMITVVDTVFWRVRAVSGLTYGDWSQAFRYYYRHCHEANIFCNPNPCGDSTVIFWSVCNRGYVELSIYNTKGDSVKTIIADTIDAGDYTTVLHTNDLPDGLYYVKINFGSYIFTTKLIHFATGINDSGKSSEKPYNIKYENDILKIEITESASTALLKIYNISGSQVLSHKFNDNPVYRTRRLAPGLYLFVINVNNRIYTEKFLLQPD